MLLIQITTMRAGKSGAGRETLLDGVAVGVSFACLIHCLALPILVALLPAWSAWIELPEAVHVWLLAFAMPFSLGVLLQAARKRDWFVPLWAGAGGLCLMALGLALESPAGETLATSAGALLLATGHVINWRRRAQRRAEGN